MNLSESGAKMEIFMGKLMVEIPSKVGYRGTQISDIQISEVGPSGDMSCFESHPHVLKIDGDRCQVQT